MNGSREQGSPDSRRRVDQSRLDAIFGETLPDTTSDETRDDDSRIRDDWWRAQRPPHHG